MTRSSNYALAGIAAVALSVTVGTGAATGQTSAHHTATVVEQGAGRDGTMSMDEMRAKVRDLMGTMSRMVGQSEGTMPGAAMMPGQGRGMTGAQGQQEMGQSMMGPTGADMMGPSGEGGAGQSEGSVMELTQSVSDLTGAMDQVMRQLQAMMNSPRTMGDPRLEREAKGMQHHLSTMVHGLEGMAQTLRQMQGRPEPQK